MNEEVSKPEKLIKAMEYTEHCCEVLRICPIHGPESLAYFLSFLYIHSDIDMSRSNPSQTQPAPPSIGQVGAHPGAVFVFLDSSFLTSKFSFSMYFHLHYFLGFFCHIELKALSRCILRLRIYLYKIIGIYL